MEIPSNLEIRSLCWNRDQVASYPIENNSHPADVNFKNNSVKHMTVNRIWIWSLIEDKASLISDNGLVLNREQAII